MSSSCPATVRCLPDGRWLDEAARTWRDRRGRPARWPDLAEAAHLRITRVVLAAAHLDNSPASRRLANLRALCQRCHMLHDQPYHRAQRWLTYRRRSALGDLFWGLYGLQPPSAAMFAPASETTSPSRGGRATQSANSTSPDWLPPKAVRKNVSVAADLFRPARLGAPAEHH